MTDAEIGVLIGGATLILVLLGVVALAMARMANNRRFWKCQAANQPPRQQDGSLVPLPTGVPTIPTDGTEVFFAEDDRATNQKPVYEVRISGLLVTRYRIRPDIEYSRTDALFKANNKTGRFEENAYNLLVNGNYLYKCDYQLIEDDRHRHYYAFRVSGLSRRIGLAFEPPQFRNADLETVGSLVASVTVLPPGTLTPKEQRKLDRELEWARQEAVEEAQSARKKAVAEAEKMARAVQAVSIRSQVMRNWEDPEFCAKFARIHCDELISRQSSIREEAVGFLMQHQLVAHLRRHNPGAVKIILGRLEALLAAERIALDRAIAAADAPKPPDVSKKEIPPASPKKKLTTEEVRAIKIRRQKVQDLDKVGLKLDKIETRLQVRERLSALPLDQDERDMLEQELFREIDAEGGDDDAKTI